MDPIEKDSELNATALHPVSTTSRGKKRVRSPSPSSESERECNVADSDAESNASDVSTTVKPSEGSVISKHPQPDLDKKGCASNYKKARIDEEANVRPISVMIIRGSNHSKSKIGHNSSTVKYSNNHKNTINISLPNSPNGKVNVDRIAKAIKDKLDAVSLDGDADDESSAVDQPSTKADIKKSTKTKAKNNKEFSPVDLKEDNKKSVTVEFKANNNDAIGTVPPKTSEQTEVLSPSTPNPREPRFHVMIDATSLNLPIVEALFKKFQLPVSPRLILNNPGLEYTECVNSFLTEPQVAELLKQAGIGTNVVVSGMRFEFTVNVLDTEGRKSVYMVHNVVSDHDMPFFRREIDTHEAKQLIQYPVKCIMVLNKPEDVPEHPIEFGTDERAPESHYYHGQFAFGYAHTNENNSKFIADELTEASEWVNAMRPLWVDNHEDEPGDNPWDYHPDDPMNLD